jgi:thymidine phosphorylase
MQGLEARACFSLRAKTSKFRAGRSTADDDTVDFAVGFSGIKKIGEPVEAQEPLLFVHARSNQALLSVIPLLEQAVEVGQ